MKMKMKKNKKSKIPSSEDLKNYLLKLATVQIPIKDKSFQKKIKVFRRKWCIPSKGFRNKTYCRNWFENSPEKILKRPKTVEQIEIEIVHSQRNEEIVKEWIPMIVRGCEVVRKISKFPFGSFFTDVDCFMLENKIDGTLKMPFLHYLYYDNFNKAPFPKQIIEVSERLTVTKSRKKVNHLICITLGPNTRQKDILTIWSKLIEPLQEKLPGHLLKKIRNRKAS